MKTLVLFEMLSHSLILVITCVLLALGWLHIYDETFSIIPVVSLEARLYMLTLTLTFSPAEQGILASMTTCAVRFGIKGVFNVVDRAFCVIAKPNEDQLELTARDRCEASRVGSEPRPRTSRSTRSMSCKLAERGVKSEDRRKISAFVDAGASRNFIVWEEFDSTFP